MDCRSRELKSNKCLTPISIPEPQRTPGCPQSSCRSSGHQAYLLEKDIWAVHTLAALFEAPFGNHLTFKGGTSLSKAYRVIQRFSEDLDITYDLRKLCPDLVSNGGPDPLPPSRSQADKWKDQITKSLKSWVNDEALPTIKSSLSKFDVSVQFRWKMTVSMSCTNLYPAEVNS